MKSEIIEFDSMFAANIESNSHEEYEMLDILDCLEIKKYRT